MPALVEQFTTAFGGTPSALVRAPGRVNLIGEHTDYNDGFVLPMAIDRATTIALRPREDTRVVLKSLDYGDQCVFDVESVQKDPMHWFEYPKGMAWAMTEAGYRLSGWEGVMTCDVPMGAGLSSSASFELAIARAFAHVGSLPWDGREMARIAQRAENEWVGVKCGIMDQMISACGEEGYALLMDCRSLETRQVPLPVGTQVVVMDTGVRRGLVDSAYNERRAQCEAASERLGVKALRDAALSDLEQVEAALPEVVARRARHVISENARTLEAEAAMQRGDALAMGRLMDASHDSLRKDFEVSCEALDVMVHIARDTTGCFGARMTGAGFGGCAVALVQENGVEDWIPAVRDAYAAATTNTPALYACRASQGACEMTAAPA